jgi:DNA-binding transcriptional LysR family regulator
MRQFQAAQRVQLPKSTVSRRIALLEAQLGERLLLRTTRKLVLTEFGASLLEHARRVAEETAQAGALAQHRQGEPSGLLRVSMPADFASQTMGLLMARLHARYPAISLELDLSPRRVDLLAENFDLAIRMGNLPDDASLAARDHHQFAGAVCRAQYASLRGLPEHPDELFQHDLLSLPPRQGSMVHWTLVRGKTRWERDLPVRLLANSPELLVRMAATGIGIAASTELIARNY